MSTETKTLAPIWLELKTDYIDANFDRLVNYLKNHPNKNDDFYQTTIELLQKRTTVFLDKLSREPLSLMDSSVEQQQERKDDLKFGVHLLGMFLLATDNKNNEYKRAFAFQQLLLAQLCSETFQNKLSQKALDTIMSDGVLKIGYEWNNIFTNSFMSFDLIANFIINNCKLRPQKSEVWYEDKGAAFIKDGKLSFVHYGKIDMFKKNTKVSISILDNRINVLVPESDKLKQSKLDDFDEVMEFTSNYIDNLKQIVNVEKKLNEIDLSIVARAIYLAQKNAELPRERYRMLCVIVIICKMIGNEAAFQMVDFVTTYIRYTTYFATGNYNKILEIKYGNLIGDDLKTDKRITIINILRNYDGIKDPDFLDGIIQHQDETLARMAKLVKAHNYLRDFLDKQILNSIKREITKMLSVDDETTKGLEGENGTYLGTEDLKKEFKTSFVYPPGNRMQPAPDIQKENIFKCVCGFLNSMTGGTLYLGVNDLGYVVGIEEDMKYLKKDTIDKYTRHIQDEAKKVFGLNLLKYITIVISNFQDGTIVELQVKPCEYKIVKFKEKEYIRINAETREMDEETKHHTLFRKISFDKASAEIKYNLLSAIETENKVILHEYSSSHGSNLRDRHVEPFEFTSGYKHIWCYDLEDNMNKQFSISRIGNVEILEEKFAHKNEHKELPVDMFHMNGTDPLHIVLKLDMMAKNLLVEEFPLTEKDVLNCIRDDDEYWQLETDVYNIAGVGRFYLGLADHIRIIEGEELKQYARDYCVRIKESISEESNGKLSWFSFLRR